MFRKYFDHIQAQFTTLQTALNHLAQQNSALSATLHTSLNDLKLGASGLAELNPLFRRNLLSSTDTVTQKCLVALWQQQNKALNYKDLLESGFRAFSQNDEDGILLRLFSSIGTQNKCVVEIGSNCNDSDVGIPENLSTNLVINHGWHGVVIEMDQIECDRMRYFFARNYATRHFHAADYATDGYYSPAVHCAEVTPGNVNGLVESQINTSEPDLFVLDIDSGDYAVLEALKLRPRVLVVEFERRFRDRFMVVQPDRADLHGAWLQSGSTSLSAWVALLGSRGYTLVTIGATGFNAFFVRTDAASGKVAALSAKDAFDQHPIFSKLDERFWVVPDQSWQVPSI